MWTAAALAVAAALMALAWLGNEPPRTSPGKLSPGLAQRAATQTSHESATLLRLSEGRGHTREQTRRFSACISEGRKESSPDLSR